MLIRRSNSEDLFVSLDYVKEHTSIDTDDFDELLTGYIKAATRKVEEETGRTLLPTEFEWQTTNWREPLSVPASPVRDVSAIIYVDDDHQEQTLPTGEWYFVVTPQGADIRFTDTFSAPALSDRFLRPVRVRLEAGYDHEHDSSPDAGFVRDPMDVVSVCTIVAHWFAQREAVGDPMQTVPMSAHSLMSLNRIYR